MKRFLSYVSAALAVLFVAVSALPASAATSSSSSALSITPRKDASIRPGQSVSDKLFVSNLNSKAELNLTLKVIDFSFMNQSGTPKLMIADNAPTTAWSLKPFIKLSTTSVTIAPGQSASIPYTLSIPANQGAGSYYSAIEYLAGGSSGNNVGLSASGVTLVFVSVPGTVNENMTLQKFGAYESKDGGATGSYVSVATNKAPTMIAYALKNSGNVAESPAGSITIRDMFNHQVKVISNANRTSSLALIGQTRLFTACITTLKEQVALEGATTTADKCVDPHLKPGRYTATLDVFYGQNGNQTHEVTGTTTFWYLPWWFLLAVVAGLAIIVGIIWFIVRKIRGGGRRVSAARR